MTKFKVFIVFLTFAFAICDTNGRKNCENDSSDCCVVIRGIESFGNIVEKYQKRLDNRVPFPQLSNAINEIDEQMGDYHGTAKKNMDSLRRLNNGLEDTYHDCVAPVFNWCISSDLTFKFFITNSTNVDNRTKKLLINMLTKKILEGHEKMTLSLSVLKKVIEDTTSIKNVLGTIHFELKQDFGPEGYYGKKKQQLENGKGRRLRRALMFNFLSGLDFLLNVARAVLALVHKVTGIALGLGCALLEAGVPSKVVDMKQAPQYDESIKIIETLYTVLDEKVRNAQRYAEETHMALVEDSNNLNALHGVLIGASDTLPLFNTDLEIAIIEALGNVRNKCLTYTTWHTSPDHSSYISRHRRDTGNANFQLQEANSHSSLKETKISMGFKKTLKNAVHLLYDSEMLPKI